MATLAAYAVWADGFPVRKMELNDTGIWVSSNRDGVFGRLNKAAGGLDALVSAAREAGVASANWDLDILQDRDLVAAWDRSNGKLVPVNTALGRAIPDQAVAISQGSQVQLRAGTLAVMDQLGRIWASRYAAGAGALALSGVDQNQKPLAELGLPADSPATAAALTVGADGTVFAAGVNGKSLTLPAMDGGFGPAVQGQLPSGLTSVQATAVGTSFVSFDPDAGTLWWEGGRSAQIPDAGGARLQQAGPAAAGVLVATKTALQRVDLGSAAVTQVDAGASGDPAAPVRLARCEYGAWGGKARVVRVCDGGAVEAQQVDGSGELSRPVFRINHGLILLNDQTDGRVWDIDTRESVDNWADLQPKVDRQVDKEKTANPEDAKPKAKDDPDLQARPERTTVLHLLDNDTDTGGSILSIKEVDTTGLPARTKVDISPDGQAVKFFLPEGVSQARFRYTVTNGHAEDSAEVSVRKPSQNTGPHLRPGAEKDPARYTTASSGNISIPVLNDWRDDQGDPVTLLRAKDEKGETVPVTPDGRLEFTADRVKSATDKVITYEVSDGLDQKVGKGSVTVHVLGQKETQAQRPIARPDVALGSVGKPIAIYPLVNDVPGADPRNPQARLTLAGEVAAKAHVTVTTDTKTGQVVARADRAGSYTLPYQASFGTSEFAGSTIRVEVSKDEEPKPVAMPDQAAIRGQAAAMVDVLANDYDPAGQLLTVQSATAVDPEALQVAVVAGRWLRITPLLDELTDNPTAIHYTISNGASDASGDVTVSQLAGIDEDRPLVRDDVATVRDGDSVLISVLTNDTSLSGAPLRLAATGVDYPAPGQLPIVNPAKSGTESQGDVGVAFVHGDQIRYVAPAKVDATMTVLIVYYAMTATGDIGTGQVRVTIKPQPGEENVNKEPKPQTVEARVVSGSRLAIPIPTSGQDPDGDSVVVTGIASAPTLGRIVGISPSSLTYEALPTAGLVGTDTFRYVVTDRYGRTGVASVRVGVVAPGQTQPPVALDDAITAAPGAIVQANVMANDLIARDDAVTISPLGKGAPQGVTLAGEQGPIVVKAPESKQQPVSVPYTLQGNGGVGPAASLTVTSEPNYNNPPIISDQTATIDGANAKADLLANSWDVDGDMSTVKEVKLLFTPEGASLTGSQLVVPMLDHPQVLPFQVVDAAGGANGAVVYVPAFGSGPPQLKPGAAIEIPQDQALSFSLADYVVSPRGKVVKIATTKIATTPGEDLEGKVDDADKFTLTSRNGYVGPGSVTVEVMDAESQTEDGVLKAWVTIPVQVGPKTPVLRCPSDAQLVMQGGAPNALDITSLCHVWSPNPDELPNLVYSAEWAEPIAGVTATGGSHKVVLQAAGTAVERSTGRVTIGVAGTPAKTATLNVTVKPAPKPRMQALKLTDILAGTPVDVKVEVTSPLMDAQPAIVKVRKISEGPHSNATATEPNGTGVTITPSADAWGPIEYEVTATDLASDPARESRWVTRTVTLVVYTAPGAPGMPRAGQTVQSHAATLTWKPAAANGAPIDYYEMTANGPGGKTQRCRSTKCSMTGLQNDRDYTFTVAAHNKAGLGPSVESGIITPDAPPSAPVWVKTSNPGDGTLTVSWLMSKYDGSPVRKFHITWDGGGRTTASAGASSVPIGRLNNNKVYTFRVAAENDLDIGPQASAEGQSSGKPLGLVVKEPSPSDSVGATTQVTVAWTLGSPNGPTPVTYSVVRSDGKKICSEVTVMRCTDDTVTFDGTAYTYTVTATNGTGGAAHSASDTSPVWKAIGTPDSWGNWSAAPTGANGTVHLTYTVPPSRGSASTLTLLINGSAAGGGPRSPGVSGGAGTYNATGLNNGSSYRFALRVCNEAGRCSTSSEKSATPFGPLGSPTVVYTGMNGNTVYFDVTGNGNGEDAVLDISANKGCSGLGNHNFGPGGTTVQVACDVGYSSSATVSARLLTGTTNPQRSNGGSDSATSPTTPAPPLPRIAVSPGAPINSSSCESTRCHYVVVTLADFPGTQTCRIVDSDQGVFGVSWVQGNGTVSTLNYFGGYWLVIRCGTVTSGRLSWNP